MCAEARQRAQHVRELREAQHGQHQAVDEAGVEAARSSEAS